MLDLKFLTDEFKLDSFDLSSLKLPKNIIYMIIAFKLINNLDKIIPQRQIVRPIPLPRPKSNMSLFVVFIMIGAIMVLVNNLLDKINISLMSCGVNTIKENPECVNRNGFYRKKCPMEKCPIKKCPIFSGESKYKLEKCPIFKESSCPLKKCPLFSNEVEDKLQKIIEEEENKNVEEVVEIEVD